MIIVPDVIDPSFTSNGLVYVTGGKNTDSPPTKDKELYLCAIMAVSIRTVVTVLYQIPNQPMKFWEETPVPKSRTEDAILAWAWRHYIDDPTADPLYLVRLPMTKAVVRAMDTTTSFVGKLNGNNIQKFIVAGVRLRQSTHKDITRQ
jgi:PhoPQ-activated pathogenicity-related protein